MTADNQTNLCSMTTIKGMYLRGKLWWLRFSVNGKQHRVPLNTPFENVAALKAMELLQRAPLEVSDEFGTELERYLQEALRAGSLSKSFAPSRRKVLRKFARDFEVRRLSDVTQKMVERWMDELRAREVKPATVQSYVFHLRAFFSHLQKRNKVHDNPAAKIELPKLARSVRKNFVPSAEVRRLIAATKDDELLFVFYAGFHAGMRYGEIVEVRWGWVSFGSGTRRGCLTIEPTPTFTPKDKDRRVVPLTREFEEFLRRTLPKAHDPGAFILRPEKKHGRHLWRVDLRKPFAAQVRKLGLHCTFHDMRRSFGSNKMIAGVSPYKGAVWTGDGFDVFQDHYGHLAAQDDDIEKGI